MRKSVEKKNTVLAGSGGRLRRWQGFVLLLVCVIATATAYNLIIPAHTLEGDYKCGKLMHVHTDACYELTEDGAFQLSCGLEEHVHEEDCLAEEKLTGDDYVCGYPYEHEHDSECYADGELICRLTEHVHTKDCLPEEEEVVAEAEPSVANAEENETPEEPTVDEKLLAALEEENTVPEPEEPVEPETTEEAEQTETPSEEQDEEVSEEPSEDASEELSEEPSEDASEVTEPAQEPSQETSEEPSEETSEVTKPPMGDVIPPEEIEDETFDENWAVEGAVMSLSDKELQRYAAALDNMETEYLLDITQHRRTISYKFEITKGNTIVNPDLLSKSDQYSFLVDINTNGLSSYTNENPYTYYYKVDLKGVDLSGSLINGALRNWTSIQNDNNVVVRAFKDDSGYYVFFIRGIIKSFRTVTFSGSASGSRIACKAGINKTKQFNAAEMAYEFVVTADIPCAIDNYGNSYKITDKTVGLGEQYNGFAENDLSVHYSDSNGTHVLMEVNDPKNNDDIAYYLSDGDMYIVNRKPHSGGHESSSQVSGLPSGWCTCWGYGENITVTVRYLDRRTAKLFATDNLTETEKEHKSVSNTATIVNFGDPNSDVGSTPSTISTSEIENQDEFLTKSDMAVGGQFTITVNKQELDLTGRSELTIEDTMVNGKLKGSVSIIATSANSDPYSVTLEEGKDFSVSECIVSEGKGTFTITLHPLQRPGDYKYEISYRVQRIDPENPVVTNTAKMPFGNGFSNSQSSGGNFDELINMENASSLEFELFLNKQYEENNPHDGATFTLFDVELGSKVCESYVENGERKYVTFSPSGKEKYMDGLTTPYIEDGTVDVVRFGTDATLMPQTIYCIEETEAPEGYDPLGRKIYFYAKDVRMDEVPYGWDDISTENGDIKIVIDNFEARENEEDGTVYGYASATYGVKNLYTPVELPETGGTGSETTIVAFGAVTLLAVGLVVLLKKRNTSV